MSLEMEHLVVRHHERSRSLFFGKYRGTVTEVSDDGSGCIKAKVPAVLHEKQTPWALPAFPFAGKGHGLVLLPEVGDGVWIEFEAGNLASPIWTGCWFAKDEAPDPKGTKVRILATSSGHKIVLDEDKNEIQLIHPGGAEFTMSSTEIVLKLGLCKLKIAPNEINLNNGMVKVTPAGASLVNDAFKVGI